VAVQLEATETVVLDRLGDHLGHAARVAPGVHERKPDEAAGVRGHDAGELAVGRRVVGAERGEQHRPRDAGGRGPAQIPGQVGAGVPGAGQPVPAPGMAMAVDDHDAAFAQ
jgi:hypothetical protein